MERADIILKFRVSQELLNTIEFRDVACNRVTFELGEPDSDGFYAPVFTTHYEDNPLRVTS